MASLVDRELVEGRAPVEMVVALVEWVVAQGCPTSQLALPSHEVAACAPALLEFEPAPHRQLPTDLGWRTLMVRSCRGH
jgi:hypothetical protein